MWALPSVVEFVLPSAPIVITVEVGAVLFNEPASVWILLVLFKFKCWFVASTPLVHTNQFSLSVIFLKIKRSGATPSPWANVWTIDPVLSESYVITANPAVVFILPELSILPTLVALASLLNDVPVSQSRSG